MEQSNRQELAASLRTGRLEGVGFPDLVWAICRRGRTGSLRVTRGGVTKTLYIQDGRIIFAASTDPNHRLGEMLLREGRIGLADLEYALARLKSGKRIGTLLVEAGRLNPEELVRSVIAQVREVVLSQFTWEEGEYRFEEGPLPTQEVITLNMETPEILLNGIRRIRSFQRIRGSVGGPRTCYRLTEGWSETVEGLSLNEGEGLLLVRLKQGAQRVENLCRDVHLSNFEIYQALWAFRVLGVVEETEGFVRSDVEGVQEGSLAEESLPTLLVRLCRSGETGVLYLSEGKRERSLHIRGGRCIFATSNNMDDGLVSFLLRRGIISLEDREETARRLLTNKRVGTILREIGVISGDDLVRMVREQVGAILNDSFRWDRGRYAFVPGTLPSDEEIVLETTLEEQVLTGVRGITSFSRITDGVGGLDTSLVLTSSYLDVLDQMNVGTDEWEVISMLRNPNRVRDVCANISLPDFRVCQILWTLRLVGAVETAEADDRVEEVAGKEAAWDSVPSGSVEEPVEAEIAEELPVSEEAAPGKIEETRDEEETHGGMRLPAWFSSLTGRHDRDLDSSPPAPQEGQREEEEEPAWSARTEENEEPMEAAGDAEPSDRGWDQEEEEPRAFDPVETRGDEPAAPPWLTESLGVESAAVESEEPESLSEPEEEKAEEEASLAPASEIAEELSVLAEEPVEPVAVEEKSAEEEEEPPDLASPEETGEEREPEIRPEGSMLPWLATVEAEASSEQLPVSREEPPGPPEPPVVETGPSWVEPEDARAEEEAPPEASVREPGPLPEERAAEATPEEIHRSAAGGFLADVTRVISREEVEAALRGEGVEEEPSAETEEDRETVPPEDSEPVALEAPEVPQVEPWEPPPELDGAIEHLNVRQRLVYRAIRAEVGAGATNLIRSCAVRLPEGMAEAFTGVEFLGDGSWEAGQLREAVTRGRVERFEEGFLALLDSQIAHLRMQIGPEKAEELHRKVMAL